MWENKYTVLATIQRNPDGSFARPEGKKITAFLENWKEAKPKTDEQIKKHFEKPHAAIAYITGKKNGVTVIDFDSTDSEKMILLAEACPTKMVKTERGFHFYYRYVDDPRFYTKAGIFGEGIDCRNDGGLVFCPPTPNYEVYGDYKLSELTEEGKDILLEGVEQTEKKDLKETTTRNDDLFRKICGWLNYYPEQEAWNRAVKANRDFNKGELDDKELETMFQSAKRYPQRAKEETVRKQEEKIENGDWALSIDEKQKRYTWGTYRLDHEIAILKRGNLVVLGAKRNMGKTSFSYDMAVKNAKLDHKVLYISLEMTEREIVEAIARRHAGIKIAEEYDNEIPEEKRQKMREKVGELRAVKNLVFRGVRRAEGVVWDTVKKIIDDNSPDIAFIDNLDLIGGAVGEENNERQKRIVSSLMNYTAEKNIPIILIHHYRKGQKNQSGMDELAGSGKVADAADIIINLSRLPIEDQANLTFPETNKTSLWVQKGRGYDSKQMDIYYVNGTFVDLEDIGKDGLLEKAVALFGGKLID